MLFCTTTGLAWFLNSLKSETLSTFIIHNWTSVLVMAFTASKKFGFLDVENLKFFAKSQQDDSPQIKAPGGVYNSYTMTLIFSEYGLCTHVPLGLMRIHKIHALQVAFA